MSQALERHTVAGKPLFSLNPDLFSFRMVMKAQLLGRFKEEKLENAVAYRLVSSGYRTNVCC